VPARGFGSLRGLSWGRFEFGKSVMGRGIVEVKQSGVGRTVVQFFITPCEAAQK